jgi:hypothetical protein
MIRRIVLANMLVLALVTPLTAQWVVHDPTNYANAVLRYGQLRQQLAQLITTYQQIRTQYLLLRQQAQKLPFAIDPRYRSLRTPWRPLVATSAYGTTTNWIDAANTGHAALTAFTRATQTLTSYGGAIGSLPAAEATRVKSRYDREQLADGAITHGLEAVGRLRFHEGSVEASIRNLETDAYSDLPDLHTQIAVLNKINATGVTAARMAKDTNYVLVALLEQQVLEATERREGAVQGTNAHVAFLTDARPLLARTTSDTTTALTTFRIP